MTPPRSAMAGILLVLIIGGCGGTPSTARLDNARRLYEQGHYLAAQRAATEAMAGDAADPMRHEAAYIAGLSAYQGGHFDEAVQYLVVAEETADPILAARSRAMRGLIELHRQRPREAATLLHEAANRLEGEDARRALEFASLADKRAGADGGSFSTGRADGSQEMTVPSGRAPAGDAPFTLQIGAFAERPRADGAARTASGLARRHGLEPVHVVPSVDAGGRTLYLVQMGRFSNEAAAVRMRRDLGSVECIVTRAAWADR